MSKHYVDNRRLLQEIVAYKAARATASSGTKPPIPPYIGEAFFAMATHIARLPNFKGYTYKDEMISDAVLNALWYLNSFKPSKSHNPFAYFSRVIYNAFLRRISTEHKETYIRDRHLIAGWPHLIANVDYDQMTERMERFERSKRKKKKK